MDFQFSQEENDFRKLVIDFIDNNIPKDLLWKESDSMSDANWPKVIEVRQKLAKAGLAIIHWPSKYGGQDGTQTFQLILREEMSQRGVPDSISFDDGFNFIGPSIIDYGSDYLKETHLPGVSNGNVFWCQGYTEPGGGSDLGSSRTTAVLQGDEYIINGQKDYIFGAARADWIHILARTNREESGHRGLSYFLVDMKSPGITLRALDEIHGRSSVLNEVFFDDLRVPVRNMLGSPEQGWQIAMDTLNRERSGIEVVGKTRGLFVELVDYIRVDYSNLSTDMDIGEVKLKLGEMSAEIEACRIMAYRVAWLQDHGFDSGYQASMSRLLAIEMWRNFTYLALRILGHYGNLSGGIESPLEGKLSRGYIESIAESIYLGTPEIHRNIIAKRGIGLSDE